MISAMTMPKAKNSTTFVQMTVLYTFVWPTELNHLALM